VNSKRCYMLYIRGYFLTSDLRPPISDRFSPRLRACPPSASPSGEAGGSPCLRVTSNLSSILRLLSSIFPYAPCSMPYALCIIQQSTSDPGPRTTRLWNRSPKSALPTAYPGPSLIASGQNGSNPWHSYCPNLDVPLILK